MKVVRNHLKKCWKKYVFLFIFCCIEMVVVLAIRGFQYLISYCDACFVTGVTCIGLGALSLLSFYGAFNGVGYIGHYVSTNFANMFRKDYIKVTRYGDYLEQKSEKKPEKKFNFIPYGIYGVLFIIIAIILLCIL